MENNKVALVTGGLSGIGKGTVLELAKQNYTTIIFDIQDDKAEEVIDEANSLGGKAYYRHCNLFSSKEIEESFQYIRETFGRLDCAFNNAGFGIMPKPFDEVTEEEIDKELGILVKARFVRSMKLN